jgi:hypothetical protein
MRQPPKKKSLEEIFGQEPAQPKRQSLDSIFAAPPSAPPSIDEPVKPRMSAIEAAGTALATGLLPESLAGIGEQLRAITEGRRESPEDSYKRGMQRLGERESQAQEALGGLGYGALQLGGGLKSAMNVPGVSARVAKDATAFAKSMAAGKRIAGGAGVAAMEAKAREGLSDQELSPLGSAALAAGITGALEAGFPLAGSLVRGIAGTKMGQGLTLMARTAAAPATEAITQARRAASDYLSTRLPQVAQAIEPSDAIRMQRIAAEELPGGMTAGALAESAGKAKQSYKDIGTALKAAETKVETALERAGARVGRVRSIGKAQAKRDAQRVLDDAETQARELIGDIRGGTPNTSAIQDVVRSFQLAEGEVSYDLVRKMGRPPEPDPEVYREMLRSPGLRGAYKAAMEAVRRELQEAVPGMPIREKLPSIKIDGQDLPELSLEMLDQVRRNIRDGVGIAPGETGLSRSAQRRAMKEINRLEDRFLAGYGNDAAANAIKAARQQYRARFEQLEALQDGLSIGMAKAGKAAKVVGKNRMELDEFVRRAEAYQGASKEMFKAGAAKWFDNLATEGLNDDAVKFLQNATKSEGALRRLRLAFNDETIAKMQQFANVPAAAEKVGAATTARAANIAERVMARGQQQAAKATGEAEALAKQLSEQRTRTQGLIKTARAGRAVERALGDTPEAKRAQDTFMGTILDRLGQQGQRTMSEIAGSDIQRGLAGLTPSEARKRIQLLQQNPVARRLVGSQLDELLARTEQRQSLVGPLRAAFIGQAAGRI